MSSEKRPPSDDDSLGMNRDIDRRDFLQGVAVAVGASAATSALGQVAAAQTASQAAPGYYPPTLTGMRGSHPGSFEYAHALRDGRTPPPAQSTGETYDLVVVGAGLSGLSAAWFWRKAQPKARILILDNHDDFGGHAKRNEFHVGGRTLILNGGTAGIDSPRPYSAVADGLIRALGIDPEALTAKDERAENPLRGLGRATFFDRETFGTDKLVMMPSGRGRRSTPDPAPLAKALADMPISEKARKDILRIETGNEDYFPGLSVAEKMDRLSRISYRDYLLNIIKADPDVIKYYQTRTHGEWGVGIDAEPALDCWGDGHPGFQGLNLDHKRTDRMGFTASGYSSTGGSYDYHFPDGNASIARLLVRQLIPAVAPGKTAEDVVYAKFNYGALDRAGAPVRIRLNSTVVHARNVDKEGVEIVYEQAGGVVSTVRAQACILAGYNMMIPYIVPELPEAQKAALHQLVKVPLVYTSVALTNWRAFKKLGVSSVSFPGGYFSSFGLVGPQAVGGGKTALTPDDPILVDLSRTPCLPGAPTQRDQHRAGRAELLKTPFEVFERNIRDQMSRALGASGFDPARDIAGIMVNRWPHGYAYEYNPLYDPWDVPETQRPHVIGRQRFGRIAIANSDSGAGAYTDIAIDQGHRAVQELLAVD